MVSTVFIKFNISEQLYHSDNKQNIVHAYIDVYCKKKKNAYDSTDFLNFLFFFYFDNIWEYLLSKLL